MIENNNDLTDRIQFRLTKQDKQQFNAVCRNLGQQPSDILRRFVLEYVQEYKDKKLVLRKKKGE